MNRTLALLALFLLLAWTICVFASSSDNSLTEAERAPLDRIASSAPRSPASSGWTATVDVVSRVGSLSVLTVALAPQTVADFTAASIEKADLSGRLSSACATLRDACRSCGTATVRAVKKTVHWLAIPLHMVRKLLRLAPPPRLPWER